MAVDLCSLQLAVHWTGKVVQTQIKSLIYILHPLWSVCLSVGWRQVPTVAEGSCGCSLVFSWRRGHVVGLFWLKTKVINNPDQGLEHFLTLVKGEWDRQKVGCGQIRWMDRWMVG